MIYSNEGDWKLKVNPREDQQERHHHEVSQDYEVSIDDSKEIIAEINGGSNLSINKEQAAGNAVLIATAREMYKFIFEITTTTIDINDARQRRIKKRALELQRNMEAAQTELIE